MIGKGTKAELMTFVDDISFLEKFRACILRFLIVGAAPTQDPLWGGRGLIDMREAMKSEEFRDLRRDINTMKGRAAGVLKNLGVVTTLHQYPPPAVGGPIVKYPLFGLITDNRSQHSIDGAVFTDKLDEAIGLLQHAVVEQAARPTVIVGEERSKSYAPEFGSVMPVFMVNDIAATLDFYERKLGFMRQSEPHPETLTFAIMSRNDIKIMLKIARSDLDPTPNSTRQGAMAWDVFVHTFDPEALATEFSTRGLAIPMKVADTEGDQRGFCVSDLDGYVLFFGHLV